MCKFFGWFFLNIFKFPIFLTLVIKVFAVWVGISKFVVKFRRWSITTDVKTTELSTICSGVALEPD